MHCALEHRPALARPRSGDERVMANDYDGEPPARPEVEFSELSDGRLTGGGLHGQV